MQIVASTGDRAGGKIGGRFTTTGAGGVSGCGWDRAQPHGSCSEAGGETRGRSRCPVCRFEVDIKMLPRPHSKTPQCLHRLGPLYHDLYVNIYVLCWLITPVFTRDLMRSRTLVNIGPNFKDQEFRTHRRISNVWSEQPSGECLDVFVDLPGGVGSPTLVDSGYLIKVTKWGAFEGDDIELNSIYECDDETLIPDFVAKLERKLDSKPGLAPDARHTSDFIYDDQFLHEYLGLGFSGTGPSTDHWRNFSLKWLIRNPREDEDRPEDLVQMLLIGVPLSGKGPRAGRENHVKDLNAKVGRAVGRLKDKIMQYDNKFHMKSVFITDHGGHNNSKGAKKRRLDRNVGGEGGTGGREIRIGAAFRGVAQTILMTPVVHRAGAFEVADWREKMILPPGLRYRVEQIVRFGSFGSVKRSGTTTARVTVVQYPPSVKFKR
ncbi:hypothetical protein BJV74DRAFT_799420 [Russula compacta]|nr:hypothetical protein BJV74DRAFT_799420 [Russula compacta]